MVSGVQENELRGLRGLLRERFEFVRFAEEAGGCGLGDEVARIEDFQRDRLVVLRKVDNDRAHLLGVLDRPFGHFDEQDVDGGIIRHV